MHRLLLRHRPILSVLVSAVGLSAWNAVPTAGRQARPFGAELLSGVTWRSIGPAYSGGRITDIEVDPRSSSVIYVGAASGGVFKSVNHGTTWAPVFDGAENLSVGDIALAPSQPDIVWVGTGEANNRNSSPYGAGIYRSDDGGRTWRRLGLVETRHIGRVVVHPMDPDTIYVAALGHLFGPNQERGVYKTADGGRTWQKVKYIDGHTGFVDLALQPEAPHTILAAAYQRRRTAFGFAGGGPGSGLYKSTDGGRTWRELTRGLPTGVKGRIGLTFSQRNPQLVLAIVEAADGGVFRSTDAGESWERLNSLNPRPMYYSKLRIDPNDDDRVYVLGTQMHSSTDGGRTFEVHDYRDGDGYGVGVHVDHHALWIDPTDSEHLLLGNDGGFYFSYDRGATWRMADNLPIQQFYDVAVDMGKPYRVFGGLQDNKSHFAPNTTRRYQGLLNRDWTVMDFGDGMYAQADPIDPAIAYASAQNGAILRVSTVTGDRKSIRPYPRDSAESYRFNWTSPFLISPHDPATLYLGGNRLFKSRNRGDSWIETEDLTRRLDRDTLRIMGLVPTAATPSRHDGVAAISTITTISESRLRAGVLWVGTDDGNVQVSRDAGNTWSEVGGRFPGVSQRFWVSRVEASASVEARAYVALDGHWDDDYDPHIFVTDDFGATWRRITSPPLEGSVNVVREHPQNPEHLLAGTETGVFASLDQGRSWLRLNGNLPRVPVDDIEIHPRENDLIVGTHGRGIWILDQASFLSAFQPTATGPQLFPVRPSMTFQYWNGVPENGQAMFRAPNAPFGAIIDYYLDAHAPEAVAVRVRDPQGCILRTYEAASTPGFHRLTWDLRLEPIPGLPPPPIGGMESKNAGPFVLPGFYTIELEAAGVRRQVQAEVLADSLIPLLDAERRARFDFVLELRELRAGARYAFARGDSVQQLIAGVRKAAGDRNGVRVATHADSAAARIGAVMERFRPQRMALENWFNGLAGAFVGGPTSQGSMTEPTEAQKRQLARLGPAIERITSELDSAIEAELPRLNRALRQAGQSVIDAPRRQAVVDSYPVVCNRSTATDL